MGRGQEGDPKGADPMEVYGTGNGVGNVVEEDVGPCVLMAAWGTHNGVRVGGVGWGPRNVAAQAKGVVAGGRVEAVGVVGVEAVCGCEVRDGGSDQAVLTDSRRLHCGKGFVPIGGGTSGVGGVIRGRVVRPDFGPHGLLGCDEREGVGGCGGAIIMLQAQRGTSVLENNNCAVQMLDF